MSTAPVFDALWDRYDSWYERHPALARSELETVRAALAGLGGPCVEVGVGTGWFASRLGCAVGVDPSIAMLRVARARGVEPIVGRAESLPLASSTIATILMVVTLCFVDDPETSIAEAARVLEPGGRLVACIVPKSSPWGRHYMREARAGHPFYSKARFLDVWEVDMMAGKAGLEREAALSTLTYPPGREEYEQPHPGVDGGFVCLRYRKSPGRG